MNIIAKRSKYKKITENYQVDNVLDIIDIEDTLKKNRYIPKVPLNDFIYEKNILNDSSSNNTNKSVLKRKYTGQALNYDDIDFDILNDNYFKINFNTLQLEYNNGYTVPFIKEYFPLEIIGHGAFGLVISAVKVKTFEKLAVKIVNKNKLSNSNDSNYLDNEMNILKKLDNPRILKIFEVLDTKNYYFIFMELYESGSLKDLIIKRYKDNSSKNLFRDEECSIIMKGILEALTYLHNNRIIHRDIKPDNIIFKIKGDLNSLVLGDFGLAYQLNDIEKFVSKSCGTTLFMAPEILAKRKYDTLIDSFSAGIILYILCSGGMHPLYKKNMNTNDYIDLILKKEKFNFPKTMPLLARNLFLKLCKYEPFYRYDTFKALKHPWITRSIKGKIPLTLIDEYEKIDKIKNFRALLTCTMFFNIFKNLYNLTLKINSDNKDHFTTQNLLFNVGDNHSRNEEFKDKFFITNKVNNIFFNPNNSNNNFNKNLLLTKYKKISLNMGNATLNKPFLDNKNSENNLSNDNSIGLINNKRGKIYLKSPYKSKHSSKSNANLKSYISNEDYLKLLTRNTNVASVYKNKVNKENKLNNSSNNNNENGKNKNSKSMNIDKNQKIDLYKIKDVSSFSPIRNKKFYLKKNTDNLNNNTNNCNNNNLNKLQLINELNLIDDDKDE